jgi:hypothetical protein
MGARKTVYAWVLLSLLAGIAGRGQSPATGPHNAIANRYCRTCHNDRVKAGELDLTPVDFDNPDSNPDVLEKVVAKLRFRVMPPAPAPKPDEATYTDLIDYLTGQLDRHALAAPNPGRPAAVHRLNRTQYVNAVRDLLALDVDGAALLPADDSGGFDNMGEVLSVSPVLMDKYLAAARKISRLAVGDPAIPADSNLFTISPNLVQGDRMSEDLPFGTRGGTAIKYHFPLDGEYEIRIRLMRSEGYVLGIAEPHFLDLRIDGRRIQLAQVGGANKGRTAGVEYLEGDNDQLYYERNADAELNFRIPVQAGTRLVQVSFLEDRSANEGLFSRRERLTLLDAIAASTDRQGSDPDVSSVSIAGPFKVQGSGDSPSRRKIFTCHPAGTAAAAEQNACARQILSTLARQAYRGSADARAVDSLMQLYAAGSGSGFETGIETALNGLLVSPNFLFRVERQPAGVQPDTPFQLSDLEIASRLSFFLWSSLPDELLLRAAEAGELRSPAGLDRQVKRMLADGRARNLIDDFAGQWLLLRNVKTKLPNRDVFPEFDENLRQAFDEETRLFLESQIMGDRPVPELVGADYTFLNERLAQFYGVPDISGSHFRRVALNEDARHGLLGQGSVLLLTSYANRTSVVQRGKWVLESLLGVPVPPPPPNVPGLKEKGEGGKGTLRQMMEAHRSNPMCSGCHSMMDPIGFALENFDGIGKWRTNDDGAPIDPSGTLPDGTKFQGVSQLRALMQQRPELLAYAVTEKLLMYALGRTLEPYDAPAIRRIVRDAAASNYRWSSLISGIAASTPFQMRRSRPL